MREWVRQPVGRIALLLAVLLILIVGNPFFDRYPLVLSALTAGGVLIAVNAVGQGRQALIVAVLLGAPTFLFYLADIAVHLEERVLVAGLVLSGAFFLYVAVVLFRHIFSAQVVGADVLLAAVCIYLLLCFAWASAYAVIEVLEAGSAFSINYSGDVRLYHFIYYSFVTMTTLGYGDIAPQTPVAQSLAILQALAGVFYMGIMMARLIALYATERPTRA
jgi:hypothetical protein